MQAALPRALFCFHRRGEEKNGNGGRGSKVAIFLKKITLHIEKKTSPAFKEVAM